MTQPGGFVWDASVARWKLGGLGLTRRFYDAATPGESQPLWFIGCEPSLDGTCPIFVVGVGDAEGVVDACTGKRFAGCHFSMSAPPHPFLDDNEAAAHSFKQVAIPPDAVGGSELSFNPTSVALFKRIVGSNRVVCHSWGTAMCAALKYANAIDVAKTSLIGGICPTGFRCVHNRADGVPCLAFAMARQSPIALGCSGSAYNAIPPDCSWCSASIWSSSEWVFKPHNDTFYYSHQVQTGTQPGVGWNKIDFGRDDINCETPKPKDPECKKDKKKKPPPCYGCGGGGGPLPGGSPDDNGFNLDPPYEGTDDAASSSGCAVAKGANGRASGSTGLVAVLATCFVVGASLRRRRSRGIVAVFAAILATGCGDAEPSPQEEVASVEQPALVRAACKIPLNDCLSLCANDPQASAMANCPGYCWAWAERCCLSYDGDHRSDPTCSAAEWSLARGLVWTDGNPTACHIDRDCNGRDDCSGTVASVCCGDANCDGIDDCSLGRRDDPACAAACGDANCDGRDDCRPNQVSNACNSPWADAVSRVCDGSSGRVVGDIVMGDVDVYAVTATAGQTIGVDIDAADNLASRLDATCRITDASGAVLAAIDDGAGSDPLLSVAAPASGTYYVWIAGYGDNGYTGNTASTGEYSARITVGGTEHTASPRGCADAGSQITSALALVAAASVPAASNGSTCASTCNATFTAPGTVTDMVLVPAGAFAMGCASEDDASCYEDELPRHTVVLPEYWIDRTEVTQAAYHSCVTAGACTTPAATTATYDPVGLANRPVVEVSFDQAATYCRWRGKRLPTEAEWEKAARGVDGRTYPWGVAAPDCTKVNYNNCIGGSFGVTAVGSYPSGVSPYGALDMAGNVAEWVQDWYSPSYYQWSPSRSPDGPMQSAIRGPWAGDAWRVTRGGSWNTVFEGWPISSPGTRDNDHWEDIRVSRRNATRPTWHTVRVGFRCVRSSHACTPVTCAELGDTCGIHPDGCGGTIDCGDPCQLPKTCGGSGVSGWCGCRPSLGGSCGATWMDMYGNGGTAYDSVTHTLVYGNEVMAMGYANAVDFGDGVRTGYYVARLDRLTGQLIASFLLPNSLTEIHDVEVTATGEIVVGGTGGGGSNGWLAKINRLTGTVIWLQHFGFSGSDTITGVAIDGSGNIWITGSFASGPFDLPGPLPALSGVESEVYIAKMAGDTGLELFSQRYGGTWQDSAGDIDIDQADTVDPDSVVATGTFIWSIDFGSGPITSSEYSGYLVKLRNNGSHVWSLSTGSASGAKPRVEIGPTGDIFHTWRTGGNPGLLNLEKRSGADRTRLWSWALGTWEEEDIAVTSAGDLVLATSFYGSMDFGGGVTLTSVGQEDVAVVRYDRVTGAVAAARSIGGPGWDSGFAIAIDGAGHLVVGGAASTLDLGQGPMLSRPIGFNPGRDAWIARLDSNGNGPCIPTTCAAQNADCGTIPDGCGGTLSCGSCPASETCGGGSAPNQCGCVPYTCQELAAECGLVRDGCGGVLDCGAPRSGEGCYENRLCAPTVTSCAQVGATCGDVNDGCGGRLACGTCSGGTTCGGGGVPNVCGAGSCTPGTCVSRGASCGVIHDGCGALTYCGACPLGQVCGGAGIANQCGACVPATCAELGANCGPVADGCGGLIECGLCPAGQTCGGGGPSRCGCGAISCQPGLCGVSADGCGGTIDCGACPAGQVCASSIVGPACCTPTTCLAEGATCGIIDDGCGGTINCGGCAGANECGGNGVGNVCGCTPATCDSLGANCGIVSDGCGGTLNCGGCQSPYLCGAKRANVCDAPWPRVVSSSGSDVVDLVDIDPATRASVISGTIPTNAPASLGGGLLSGRFLAKYGADGAHIWSIGSLPSIAAIAIDASGNVIVGGQDSADLYNIYLTKRDGATGAVLWTRSFGGSSPEYLRGVAVLSGGDVVATGYYTGANNSVGGAALPYGGVEDLFVARYAAATGAHVWSKTYSDGGSAWAEAIAVDTSDAIWVTGGFNTTLNFGTKAATRHTTAGSLDVFVGKLSASNGSRLWSGRFGGTGWDIGTDLDAAPGGAVVVVGTFQGNVSFGEATFAAGGNNDDFAVKLSSAGAHVWSIQLGGDWGSEQPPAVAVNPWDGNLLIGGDFDGWADFGGGLVPGGNGYYEVGFWVTRYGDTGAPMGWGVWPVGDSLQDVALGPMVGSSLGIGVGSFDGSSTYDGVPVSSVGSSDGIATRLWVPEPACTPVTCVGINADCGSLGNGCGGTIACGSCGAGATCAVHHQCCLPRTCASAGAECGAIDDGCGGTLVCGDCPGWQWPAICGGGSSGLDNACECPAGGCDPLYWSRLFRNGQNSSESIVSGAVGPTGEIVLAALLPSWPAAGADVGWIQPVTGGMVGKYDDGGGPLWITSGTGNVNHVAADATGAIAFVGSSVTLVGASGEIGWTRSPVAGTLYAVGFNGAGDVLASGSTVLAVKLRRSDGATLWTAAAGDARDSSVDPASGDVFVAHLISAGNTSLVRVRGTDGGTIWSVSLGSSSTQVQADGLGNVYAVTSASPVLRKHRGVDGAQLWSASVSGGTVRNIAIDGAGNLLVAGTFQNTVTIGSETVTASGAALFLAKLHGASGAVLWTQSYPAGTTSSAATIGLLGFDTRTGSTAIVLGGSVATVLDFGVYGSTMLPRSDVDAYLARIPEPSYCTPTTCAAQGVECGNIPDGCGGTLSCGGCAGSGTCGGTCTAGLCSYPGPATTCNDGSVCTSGDACNGAGACLGSPATCGAADGCCPSGCTTDPDCATCNDGICACTETPTSCPADCIRTGGPPANRFECGANGCEPAETPTTCPRDCGTCP